MPKRIDWKDVALGTTALDAEGVLGALKTYEVTKCNQLACAVCPEDAPHKMRYRLLNCASEACARSVSLHGQPFSMAREDLIVHGERRGVDIPGGGSCFSRQLLRKEASDAQQEDVRPGADLTPPTANENQARYVAEV